MGSRLRAGDALSDGAVFSTTFFCGRLGRADTNAVVAYGFTATKCMATIARPCAQLSPQAPATRSPCRQQANTRYKRSHVRLKIRHRMHAPTAGTRGREEGTHNDSTQSESAKTNETNGAKRDTKHTNRGHSILIKSFPPWTSDAGR